MEHENRRRYQDVTEAEYLPKKHVGFATRAIHAGQHPDKEHGSVNVPIHMSSTFAQREPTQLYSEFDYARCNNPTRNAFEQCMAACEYGNHALEFASGCGAMTAVLHLLGSADHVVCCDDVYGGTQRYMRRFLQEKHGIEVTFVDMTNLAETEAAIRPNTRLVWIETPTNPMLKIIDVETVTRLVRAKRGTDAWVLVDNTFATPYLQSPLEYGCDMVLHSLSKYIGGHSDLIGGAVVMKDKDLYEQLFFSAKSVGANPSAFDSYLVLRGLKTLEARMKIHCKNALILARWLERHPHVEKVLYPGLESHPQHELAKRQMRGFGGMISFYVKGDRPQANKFLSSLKVFTLAESLGGVESLVEHPASMTHGSVPLEHRNKLGILEGFIRVSVGIEDVQDLIDDLDEALELSQKV